MRSAVQVFSFEHVARNMLVPRVRIKENRLPREIRLLCEDIDRFRHSTAGLRLWFGASVVLCPQT
jgi:hypothetical protein